MTRTRSVVMMDVARAAGVSHQTVSRVLNNNPRVSPETRQRVLEVIRDLRYTPNRVARSLVTRRTWTIGVVTADITMYGSNAEVFEIERAAREAGYAVSIASSRLSDRAGFLEAIGRLHAQGVDGVLAIAPELEIESALKETPPDLPLVGIGTSAHAGVSAVSMDNQAGATMATDHLLSLGHATVHHLAGPDNPSGHERIAGWRAALLTAGAPVSSPVAGDWSARSGYLNGRRLAQDPLVTAVFCANDHVALGLLRALHESGRAVPRDVSVVGFDDVPETPYYTPPLTSVRQPFADVGRRGMELIVEQIENDTATDMEPGRELIAPELIVRDSTGPPPFDHTKE